MFDHIRIGDVSPRVQYAADGVQTTFIFPFPVFSASNVEVYLDDEQQSNGYDVAGVGESGGGTVIFDAAPAGGVIVTLRRFMTIERTTDFQEGGTFLPKPSTTNWTVRPRSRNSWKPNWGDACVWPRPIRRATRSSRKKRIGRRGSSVSTATATRPFPT